MVWVCHMGLVLALSHLLLLHLLRLELLNLLLERLVLGQEGAVGLVALRHVFFVDEQLRDDLIHSLVVRANLWSLILFYNLPPVHIFKLIANIALSNDSLKDLDTIAQLAILSRKVEVLVFASIYSIC